MINKKYKKYIEGDVITDGEFVYRCSISGTTMARFERYSSFRYNGGASSDENAITIPNKVNFVKRTKKNREKCFWNPPNEDGVTTKYVLVGSSPRGCKPNMINLLAFTSAAPILAREYVEHLSRDLEIKELYNNVPAGEKMSKKTLKKLEKLRNND